MATDTSSLIERALEVQQRLEQQGAVEDAQVIEQLVNEIRTTQEKTARERPYYTVSRRRSLSASAGRRSRIG